LPSATDALAAAVEAATAYLESVGERHVGGTTSAPDLRARLDTGLPDRPLPAADVVRDLATAADPGIVASAGGRYFGFVIGGSLPAASGADVLVTAWDQCAAFRVLSPANAVIEEIAGAWLLDLLGLPPDCGFGFTTGAQQATTAALAAARHQVLTAAGWDLATDGLFGAPPIRVVVGEDRHATIDRALRFLGIGRASLVVVPSDDQSRMRVEHLPALDGAPTIVCSQAGNVNTGAFDDLAAISDAARAAGAWHHVDGAFGMWAAASPRHRHLAAGADGADSWSIDGHKWLNVPYDCGVVVSRHPASHAAALTLTASYLQRDIDREPADWSFESSRRARAVPVYAALRSLGRQGVADLVDRCCALARRFADRLGAEPGVEIGNDVVLNQVLVRFGDDDVRTRAIVDAVQRDGTCWMGSTVWRGRAWMRISVSSWATTEDDVDRSVDAVLRCASAVE
jgi:glutamate/tyrosine decarboxylase-like PLP-dependent enzyme